MWETSTCPRATQDVECETVRGTHRVGRTAPLAMPCRDNSAIPRQTGSLLSQRLSSALAGPRLPALGILGEALAPDGHAMHQSGAPPFHAARTSWSMHSRLAAWSQLSKDAEPFRHHR